MLMTYSDDRLMKSLNSPLTLKCQMSDISLMKICRFYGHGPQGGDLGALRPMHHCVTG